MGAFRARPRHGLAKCCSPWQERPIKIVRGAIGAVCAALDPPMAGNHGHYAQIPCESCVGTGCKPKTYFREEGSLQKTACRCSMILCIELTHCIACGHSVPFNTQHDHSSIACDTAMKQTCFSFCKNPQGECGTAFDESRASCCMHGQ